MDTIIAGVDKAVEGNWTLQKRIQLVDRTGWRVKGAKKKEQASAEHKEDDSKDWEIKRRSMRSGS